MKGTIMSFWMLSVTFSNLWVLLTNAAIRSDTVSGMVAQSGLSKQRVPHVLLRRFRLARSIGVCLVARSAIRQPIIIDAV